MQEANTWYPELLQFFPKCILSMSSKHIYGEKKLDLQINVHFSKSWVYKTTFVINNLSKMTLIIHTFM